LQAGKNKEPEAMERYGAVAFLIDIKPAINHNHGKFSIEGGLLYNQIKENMYDSLD